MTTRSEFIDYCEQVFIRTDKESLLISCLDDTLRDLSLVHKFEANKSISSVTLVSDQYIYDFPTSFLTILGDITFLDSGSAPYVLNKISKEEFNLRYPDIANSSFSKSKPLDYAIFGNQIYIAPFLETVTTETLRVDGTTLASALASDSTDLPLGDEWRETIRGGVLGRAYAFLEDTSQSEVMFALYNKGIEQFKQIDDDNTDVVRITNYAGGCY